MYDGQLTHPFSHRFCPENQASWQSAKTEDQSVPASSRSMNACYDRCLLHGSMSSSVTGQFDRAFRSDNCETEA